MHPQSITPRHNPFLDISTADLDRFWAGVDRSDPEECWDWQRSRTAFGYGQFVAAGRNHRAHRVAYQAVKGPIDGAWLVCHRCDNPACCNPDHLFLGSYGDNTMDAKRKGRRLGGDANGRASRGTRHYMAAFTEEQVRAIRQDPRSQTEIARDYGVSSATIHRIVRRLTYREIV